MNSVFGVILLGWFFTVGASPFHDGHEGHHEVADTAFIGKGTNELATALLQGYVQKEENMVYSPFGYSAILAIFSEGARGTSRQEIANALHFPENVEKVRLAYRSVIERFVGKRNTNSPEFKNWFYIYKNYTVEEELQNVLRKYYLTEVKCVDRPEDYIKDTKRAPIMEDSTDPDKKLVMEMSKVEHSDKMSAPMDEVKEEKKPEIQIPAEVPKSEENSVAVPEATNKGLGEGSENRETKINGRSMKEEMTKPETSGSVEKQMEESASSSDSTKMVEKMEPIKTSAEMGPLPVEHFSGMTDSSLRIKGQESKPRMVIFNGLYYKGEWETPFTKMPADDSRVFYTSDTEKVFVSTIHSQGVFNYGEILNLDSKAIELPYKGGRYSLLILVPNSRNGLTKLISDLSGYSFNTIYDQLSEKLVDVCLPSFEINTISKPISSLNKMGLTKVTSIFNPETADLSGISAKDTGLYVEELVQMVTFKVDADNTKANFLTASIASSRSNVQKFQINQPFLFYLRDNLEDIIIVNGKVIDPTPKPSFYFS